MRRPGTAVALGLVASTMAKCAGGGASSASRTIALRSCGMQVAVVKVPAERVRKLLPAPYRVGSYFDTSSAALAIWVVSCRRIGDGARSRPGIVALLGVQVAPTFGLATGRPSPATFEHYLLAAQTDDPGLWAAARRVGLPVSLEPGLSVVRGEVTTVTVPGRRLGYRLAFRSRLLDQPHDHANVFWWTRRDGGTSALRLAFRHANDHYCRSGDKGCRAVLAATPGGTLSRLMGRDALSPDRAFDHLVIPRGRLALNGPSRNR
jgi:hypothetical protein